MRTAILVLIGLFVSGLGRASSTLPEPQWERYEYILETDYASPEALARDIRARYSSEFDRAAAIYYWVARSIAYDTKLMHEVVRSGPKAYTLEELEREYEGRISYAWKTRRGVCDNYTRLMVRLCDLVGLQAQYIKGHARGDYLATGSLGIGHAWNAIKVDGTYHLMDATWGAGHVTSALRFEREFKPQYFAPNPVSFSYSHHPEEAKWQLRANPMPTEAFLSRVAVGRGFLRYDLRSINYDEYELSVEKGEPLRITGVGERLPSQFIVVDLAAEKQIAGATSFRDTQFSIVIPPEALRNMKLGILNPQGEVVLAYQVRVSD